MYLGDSSAAIQIDFNFYGMSLHCAVQCVPHASAMVKFRGGVVIVLMSGTGRWSSRGTPKRYMPSLGAVTAKNWQRHLEIPLRVFGASTPIAMYVTKSNTGTYHNRRSLLGDPDSHGCRWLLGL